MQKSIIAIGIVVALVAVFITSAFTIVPEGVTEEIDHANNDLLFTRYVPADTGHFQQNNIDNLFRIPGVWNHKSEATFVAHSLHRYTVAPTRVYDWTLNTRSWSTMISSPNTFTVR